MKLIIHFHILYIKKCVTYVCKKHKNRQCDALKQKLLWNQNRRFCLSISINYFVLYQEHLFKNQNKHVLVNQKFSNIKIFESSII